MICSDVQHLQSLCVQSYAPIPIQSRISGESCIALNFYHAGELYRQFFVSCNIMLGIYINFQIYSAADLIQDYALYLYNTIWVHKYFIHAERHGC